MLSLFTRVKGWLRELYIAVMGWSVSLIQLSGQKSAWTVGFADHMLHTFNSEQWGANKIFKEKG